MGTLKRWAEGKAIDYTPDAALVAGTPIQLADGRAAVVAGDLAASEVGAVRIEGHYIATKSTSYVIIKGAPLWWDRSAGNCGPVPPLGAGDRDFYLGVALEDATAAATTIKVDLNVQPQYEIDMHRDLGDTVVVLTAGTPYIYSRGGALEAGFSATAEAQKLDWISKRSFLKTAHWILEAVINVVTNADADVADLNVGIANATHASDADSITESAFFHYDMGADDALDAESDDGSTEVTATDTTINWAAGTPLHLVIDGRDLADLHMYVNGAEVLAATTFDISAATGPFKALFHLEKTANDSPGVVQCSMLRVRYMEQD